MTFTKMAYTKTNWKDRVVEKPRTYTLQQNPDGTVTLIPAPGTIYESGTHVNAPNLNKIEQGIADAHALNVDNVTISDIAAPTSDTAGPKTLFNWMAHMIKAITGKGSWRTAPRTTLENAVKRDGDIMTAALKFSGQNSENGIMPGNGDNSNMDTCNVDLFSWHGIGIKGMAGNPYGNGARTIAINARNGSMTLRGGIKTGYGASGPGYDVWDTSKLRINNGRLEFLDGGTWKPVGLMQVGRERTAFAAGTNNVWATVVNISGVQGRLEQISGEKPGNGAEAGRIRVTIDGISETIDYPPGNPITYLNQNGVKVQDPIYFFNSLKVEVTASTNWGGIGATVVYRLKLGSP